MFNSYPIDTNYESLFGWQKKGQSGNPVNTAIKTVSKVGKSVVNTVAKINNVLFGSTEVNST